MVGPSPIGPFLSTPLGSGTLTSNDLPGPSEIHQGLGPCGPGCSYATVSMYMQMLLKQLKMTVMYDLLDLGGKGVTTLLF